MGALGFGEFQNVALEEGLTEGRRKVDIVPSVFQVTIRLYTVCFEETVD